MRIKHGSMAFILILAFVSSAMVLDVPYCQSSPTTNNYIYVLVNGPLYHSDNYSLRNSLLTYEQDLEENDEFSVIIQQVSAQDTPEDVKGSLRSEWLIHEAAGDQMMGALLVGDIPYAKYEVHGVSNQKSSGYVENLYLMEESSPLQDFTTFKEEDPFGRISRNSTRVTFENLKRDSWAYVCKDMGENHFSGDFKHKIDVNCRDLIFNPYSYKPGFGTIWSLGNVDGSWRANLGDRIGVELICDPNPPGKFRMQLSYSNGVLINKNNCSGLLDQNKTYYPTITRNGTIVTCEIYNDAARTDPPFETLTINTTYVTAYRYIFARQNFGTQPRPQPFPCDLYYMDLDGNWTDRNVPPNGVYDMHTNETGDLEPEIWIGRLYASTVKYLFDSTEVSLLNKYFGKNHRFRTGELTLPRRALGYIDDDFTGQVWVNGSRVYYADYLNSSLRMIYANETTVVEDKYTTNGEDYKNRLNDTLGYEWLHLTTHSWPDAHQFEDPSGEKWTVHSFHIRDIDPHVFFYELETCNAADYTCYRYIGGAYIFAETYGLLAIGSTTESGPLNPCVDDFYERVAEGKCIGEAFKELFKGLIKEWGEGEPRKQYYGLTILGDPALRRPRIYNQTRDVAVTNVTASDSRYNETEVHKGWNVNVTVTVENEGIFVETFNVTVSAYKMNTTSNETVGTQSVIVFPGANKTLSFIWDTDETSDPWGHYSIEANASTVHGETDIDDNTIIFERIRVKITGDVNGDGTVSVADMVLVDIALGSKPGEPNWNPQADVDHDGSITVLDMVLVDQHLGESES